MNNNYYLAYENGEIVAGLQANPEEWQIVEMGGFGGILLKLLDVMVKFVSFNEVERKEYTDKPAYLCAYDMT